MVAETTTTLSLSKGGDNVGRAVVASFDKLRMIGESKLRMIGENKLGMTTSSG